MRHTGADIDAETLGYKLSEKEVKMLIDTLGRRSSGDTVTNRAICRPKQ